MLTPQEISGKEFTKAVFGGYDMSTVDEFLETVTKDYTDLYKENAVLKNKMKVLVEKVEEYRSTEDSMRMALLTAQKMAKEITDGAEKKAKEAADEAERAYSEQMAHYRDELAAEEKRLDAAKQKTSDFIAASMEIINKHSEFLSKISEYAAPEEPVSTQDKQAEAEKKADDMVAQIMEKTMSSDTDKAEEETAEADNGNTKVFKAAESPTDKKPKFEFVNLQFGDDYDATK